MVRGMALTAHMAIDCADPAALTWAVLADPEGKQFYVSAAE